MSLPGRPKGEYRSAQHGGFLMRHPVSASRCFEQQSGGAMSGRLAGFAFGPGAPDHAQPGTREDTDGVRTVRAWQRAGRSAGPTARSARVPR